MKRFLITCCTVALTLLTACQKGTSEPVADINQGAAIMGVISLAPGLKAQVKPTDTVFIIARKDVGPPLAVKKITAPTFPLPYQLTAADVMFPGTPFQGEVKVVARVDRDGNAGPAQPGDLEGTAQKIPARVGDRDIDIVIDKAL